MPQCLGDTTSHSKVTQGQGADLGVPPPPPPASRGCPWPAAPPGVEVEGLSCAAGPGPWDPLLSLARSPAQGTCLALQGLRVAPGQPPWGQAASLWGQPPRPLRLRRVPGRPQVALPTFPTTCPRPPRGFENLLGTYTTSLVAKGPGFAMLVTFLPLAGWTGRVLTRARRTALMPSLAPGTPRLAERPGCHIARGTWRLLACLQPVTQ